MSSMMLLYTKHIIMPSKQDFSDCIHFTQKIITIKTYLVKELRRAVDLKHCYIGTTPLIEVNVVLWKRGQFVNYLKYTLAFEENIKVINHGTCTANECHIEIHAWQK